jgi:hypothetical protein
MLAGWEFVVLAPAMEGISFEAAGRQEFADGVLSPVYAMAIAGEGL